MHPEKNLVLVLSLLLLLSLPNIIFADVTPKVKILGSCLEGIALYVDNGRQHQMNV